jgi:hypothetical protein
LFTAAAGGAGWGSGAVFFSGVVGFTGWSATLAWGGAGLGAEDFSGGGGAGVGGVVPLRSTGVTSPAGA